MQLQKPPIFLLCCCFIQEIVQLCSVWFCLYIFLFSVQLFCQFCVVIRFFHPRHNGQWPRSSKDFYTRSYPLHYFLILILEKEPEFPFVNVWVLKKGTTGTIFITYLVWRVPWLRIEPGTSRTRSQHSTTRLSRRRLIFNYWQHKIATKMCCELTRRPIKCNVISLFNFKC